MSTAAILSSLSSFSAIEQFLAEFKQLGQDLSSGNLSAAQQDFVTLSDEVQSASSTSAASQSAVADTESASTSTGSSAQSTESTLASEFQTLGQDLQNGDLTGAQQAFSQIQQTVQSSGGGSHVHGHPHGQDSEAAQIAQILQAILGGSSSTSTSSTTGAAGTSSSSTDSSSAASSSSSGDSSTVTLATLKQDFEAVGSALQSGNVSAAQQAFTQFKQDVSSFASETSTSQSGWGGPGAELWQAFMASQNSGSADASASSGSTIDTTA